MRIQRLEITGFKSFVDRTIISFDDGITGIVGPNGCGKSNVVDAIRWVMGEQSAKHLRGRSMEDVIFNGSEIQPPSGLAEVALTFQNDRPSEVPTRYQGFSEITVQRRLFRSGESEYLVNQTPCRLMDITELFLGTGVGTRAYSIIEQGRIGLIVNAKPEDRRAIIEEAAGITKYKARKKAAERKMEFTEQNLARVNDIVQELEKRRESLDRQAKKAEKYRRVKGEIRELELWLGALRWLELQALAGHLAGRLEALEEDEKRGALATEELDLAIVRGREVLEAIDRELADCDRRSHEVELGRSERRQAIEFGARELERLRESRAQRLRELERLSERRGEFERALEEQRSGLEQLAQLCEAQARALAELEPKAAALAARERERQLATESGQKAARELGSSLSALEQRIAGLERRRPELVSRREENERETGSLSQRLAEIERRRGEQAQLLEETRQLKLSLAGRRDETERSLVGTRERLGGCREELGKVKDELSSRRSRLQSLLDLQRSYEGCDRGVRAVMLESGERPEGARVRGLVADAIRVPVEAETAIEAVLGERLQHVLVEERADAVAIARWLAASGEGRCTFVPVAGAASVERPAAELPAHPGIVGFAIDLAQVAVEFAPVARELLQGVVVVRGLEDALELRDAGVEATLATLGGEVLWARGALSGGTADGRGAGELQQRREIAELTGVVASLDARLLGLSADEHELASRAAQLDGDLRGLARDAHAEELNFAHRERDLAGAGEDLGRTRSRLERLAEERRSVDGQLAELDSEDALARREREESRAELERREAELAAAKLELATVAGEREAAGRELTARKVEAAAASERREAMARQRGETERALVEGARRAETLAAELSQADERIGLLAEDLGRAEVALAELNERALVLVEERQGHSSRREAAAADLSRLEGALREERQRLEGCRGALSDAQLQLREKRLEQGHVVSSLAEKHDADVSIEVSRFHLEPPPGAEGETRLAELKQALARMGEVNLMAIEELREVTERFDFLRGQQQDLEQSLDRLRQAIARMNRTSRERFRETFELVNQRFSEVFPRLFAGGKAGLVLSEGADDPLEAGIEIVAQPPGKRLQSVNLLSGGEKALTAVGLIFAIFLIKPTPFCLLDEVDAPLDEGNVGRYNDMVREMSRLSQFILITHNKRTMEIADTLYGVTMEDPGCSKLVSVRFTDKREATVAA